jgi:hypothetical protein
LLTLEITFARCLTIIVVTVVTLVQCRAQQPTTQSEEVKSGTITGKVFNDAGQPLMGATVSVRSAGIIFFSNRTTQTNSEGTFQITGLEAALYYVSAFSPAYVSPPASPDDPPRTYRVGDTVRLDLIRGGVITGSVTNANNDPVIGVRVRALMVKDASGKEVKGSFGGSEKQTDDRGIYRLYGLSPGTYIVFAGGSGSQFNALNATDFDAPTYAPSSTRDTASEVQVRSGDETTVDIRYRYEQGHAISGSVRTTSTNGVSIMLTQANGAVTPMSTAFQPTSSKGFVFYGIADGDYTLTASEQVSQTSNSLPGMAVSDPLRITVKGGDLSGVELVPKPLGSISGKIALEPAKLPECQNKRQPAFTETMISLIQNKKDPEADPLALIRTVAGVSVADKDGAFVLKNLRAGQYALSPRFFARYWYLKSILLSSTAAAPTGRGSAPLAKEVAKNWTSLKSGERLMGLTITLSEGAGSIKGKVEKSEAGLRVYIVPAERDKLDDPLRYFSAEVGSDGIFTVTNLPPGKYWTIAQQPQADVPTTTDKLQLPDSMEARLKIRRAAEAAKMEVELKPCQNLTELTLRPN